MNSAASNTTLPLDPVAGPAASSGVDGVHRLGRSRSRDLEQLIDSIESQTDLFSADLERAYFLTMVENEFVELSRKIQRALQEEEKDLADNADWPAVQRATVIRVIQDECNEWAERPAYGDKISDGTGIVCEERAPAKPQPSRSSISRRANDMHQVLIRLV